MSGEAVHQNERQSILTRLLEAVKQCQVRFGGRSELATDSDSRVSCLCAAWEAALHHGLKKNNKALSAFKQMTEKAGLAKVTDLFSDIKRIETEQVFWHYAKEHLTKHEQHRFTKLKLVNTDTGRGRAWLRASLNEHSLERYMHMLIENDKMLAQHYEEWAFLRDEERNTMLPNMAAGLGSILFAITVDRPELNKGYSTQNSVRIENNVESVGGLEAEQEPSPVISEELSPVSAKRKDKKKKRKVANVVSFDEDDTDATVITRTGSSTSDSILPESVRAQLEHNGETRENGEGTQVDTFFVTESAEKDTEEAQGTDMSQPKLEQEMSQVSISSLVSSDRLSKSSLGSFSDLDPDSGSAIVPLGVDGVPLDSEMVPYNQSLSHQTSLDVVEPASQGQRGMARGSEEFMGHLDAKGEIERLHERKRDGEQFGHTDMESASFALALAQGSLTDSRTAGDGGSPQDSSKSSNDFMTHDELKKAVVTMMMRKDSIEEQNRKLEGMFHHEMEVSSTLRAEIEELKTSNAAIHEKEQAKIQTLQKENELLKHQLKKYVNAVQMLRTEGVNKEEKLGINLEDPQPGIPPSKPMIDYSHEAAEYEKKLIQVAEMHGELMEFNESLHRLVTAKDAVIRQIREELILLRGPLPYDRQRATSAGQELENFTLQHTLINIWIPSAFLRGTSNNTHHVYQVYVRIRDEEWNVYRRYSQFLDTHQRLRKVYPLIGKFEFPPKKAIGKKEAKLVEIRRRMFQSYLRNVINVILEKNEQLANAATKERLISYLPFFNDNPDVGTKKGRKKNKTSSEPRTTPLSATSGAASFGEGAEASTEAAQYQGL